jgi:hypothetical protein
MITTIVVSSAIQVLPNSVVENIIFANLSLPELGACSRVCKVWREMAKKHLNAFSHEKAFGPKEWFIYFGAHLRNVPRLPSNIAEILNSPCLFWNKKKVHETHLLVLVPQTFNGQPLTLKTLAQLVKKPLQGFATQYSYLDLGKYTDHPAVRPSHWVMMTRHLIEGSRSQSYKDQQTLLSQKGHGVYEVPTLFDATVCIFMEYVRSGALLYGDKPRTYTRCQEMYNADWQLCVGCFSLGGLHVDYFGGDYDYIGVGGTRKWEVGH